MSSPKKNADDKMAQATKVVEAKQKALNEANEVLAAAETDKDKKTAKELVQAAESEHQIAVEAKVKISAAEVTKKTAGLNDTNQSADELDHAAGAADVELSQSVLDDHEINKDGDDGKQTQSARAEIQAALDKLHGNDAEEVKLPDNPDKLKGLLKQLIKDQTHVVAERNELRVQLDKSLKVADRTLAVEASAATLLSETEEDFVEVVNCSMPSRDIVCMAQRSKTRTHSRHTILCFYFQEDEPKPVYVQERTGTLVNIPGSDLYNIT